jgi:regulator of protease activity HflC (stomatin/prohibitin superfamily)
MGIVLPALGCTFQTIDPGHAGLAYAPNAGLQRTVIPSSRVLLGHFCALHACTRIYDFDITYSTTREEIRTAAVGDEPAITVRMNVIYRPIISELYELATEVGTNDNYYNKVVGPELRSAAGALLAGRAVGDLATHKERVEDDIENDVRRRINGKHVELASITIESIEPTTRSPSCP